MARDNASVWLYSRQISIGSTLPMTEAEARRMAHKPSTVVGCYEVERDLSLREDILDPDGDRELRRELRYGKPVVMKRCEGIHHPGRRVIPATEFTEGDALCKGCRALIEHRKRAASMPEVARKSGWKRLRAGKLGKGGEFHEA